MKQKIIIIIILYSQFENIIDPVCYKLKKAVGAVSEDDASKEGPMLPLTALITNIRPCSSVCLYVPMYIYIHICPNA